MGSRTLRQAEALQQPRSPKSHSPRASRIVRKISARPSLHPCCATGPRGCADRRSLGSCTQDPFQFLLQSQPGAQPGSPGKCPVGSGLGQYVCTHAHLTAGARGLSQAFPVLHRSASTCLPPAVGLILLTVALGKSGGGDGGWEWRDTPCRGLCLFYVQSKAVSLLRLSHTPAPRQSTELTHYPPAQPLALVSIQCEQSSAGTSKACPQDPAFLASSLPLPAPPHSLLSGSCPGRTHPQPPQPLPSLTMIMLSASFLPSLVPGLLMGVRGPKTSPSSPNDLLCDFDQAPETFWTLIPHGNKTELF